jgi:hypothetical protein
MQLERILEISRNEQSAISLEEYQTLISIKDKDQIQINLPARDIFSEEIKVFISNCKHCPI